jgi:hypothetical protein
MLAPMHRRNNRHWNPPLSRKALARMAERKREVGWKAMIDAMILTKDDLLGWPEEKPDPTEDKRDDSEPISA